MSSRRIRKNSVYCAGAAVSAVCGCLLFALAASASPAFASLVDAAEIGDTQAALERLEAAPDSVDIPQSDGTTALLWAVYHQDIELATALLKTGANPNVRNHYGASALSEAAMKDDNAMLALLLEYQAEPNIANHEGEVPLMVAARAGNLEGASLLLAAGADVNAREQWGGQSALMWAAAQSQADMLALLIEHGADINAHGYARIWDRRITSEPRPKDMNKGGFSALMYAARQGCVECVEVLANAGADLDATDPDRVTALNIALLNLHFDTAAALIAAGADVNKWDLFGRSPLYNAVDLNTLPTGGRRDIPSMDKLTGYDIARLLLEHGANPNMQLKLAPPFRNAVFDRGSDKVLITGTTPLLLAAQTGDVASVQLLLEYGALVDLPNKYGQTPFMVAAGVDYASSPTRGQFKTQDQGIAILELLLTAGADINALSGDPTLRPGGNEIARIDRNRQMHPANRGPDVIEGKTALHGAARNGWNDIVQWLLDHGIRQQVVDAAGRTPLDYAMARYPPAYNDTPPIPLQDTAMILREACLATDACSLNEQLAVD